MENKDKIFADGFKFDKPREGAPDFVKGKLTIKVPEAIMFLEKYQNNGGWVNLDLKKSQKGTLYLELNTWKPENAQGPVPTEVEYPAEKIRLEDSPF